MFNTSLATVVLLATIALGAFAQTSTSYRASSTDDLITTVPRKNNEALALLVDINSNAAPRFHWQTNYEFAVDTTAGGIAANDVLAPVLTISTPRNNMPTEIERVSIIGGDTGSANLVFDLLICKAPLTWGTTNAVANLVLTQLQTNLATVIRSTDGAWGLAGATNYIWTMTNTWIGRIASPMTNSLFIYAVNRGAITNTNTMYINFTLKQ